MSTSKMTWMAAVVIVGVAGTAATSFADTATDTTRTKIDTSNQYAVTAGPGHRFEGLSASQVRPDGLMTNGLLPTNPDAQG